MNVWDYLQRIGYGGSPAPTAKNLAALHRAHMLSVPFENLDIGLRPIVLDEARIVAKIVNERRGGFCYELNGAFAWLLREMGYRVTLLSARVANQKGVLSREFDHLVLRVDVGQPYLADVGFGQGFTEPLRLEEKLEQTRDGVIYRLLRSGESGRWLLQNREGDQWHGMNDFSLTPRRLCEFAALCHFHQTSPESSFTNRRVCSRVTPEGRLTLADMRFIITRNGQREERILERDQEYHDLLREQFGVVLPRECELD